LLLLVSLGLGNEDFTAWVEPYEFFNAKIMGTAVSAPAFDRSVDPPVLVGVVAMDFPMSALDRALGVSIGSTTTFDRVVQASTAVCPNLEISTCQLEAFRESGPSGADASCGAANCTGSNSVVIDGQPCRNRDDFPSDVIANRDVESLGFEQRSCCVVGTNTLSDQCFQDKSSGSKRNTGMIAGISIGAAVGLCILAAVVARCNADTDKEGSHNNVKHSGRGKTESIESPQPVESLHVLQPLPPHNPHAETATAPTAPNTLSA
jgi:hypothetical protein